MAMTLRVALAGSESPTRPPPRDRSRFLWALQKACGDLGLLPIQRVARNFARGGGGWIRTNVGVRQRIYSPSPLATRAPLRAEAAT